MKGVRAAGVSNPRSAVTISWPSMVWPGLIRAISAAPSRGLIASGASNVTRSADPYGPVLVKYCCLPC